MFSLVNRKDKSSSEDTHTHSHANRRENIRTKVNRKIFSNWLPFLATKTKKKEDIGTVRHLRHRLKVKWFQLLWNDAKRRTDDREQERERERERRPRQDMSKKRPNKQIGRHSSPPIEQNDTFANDLEICEKRINVSVCVGYTFVWPRQTKLNNRKNIHILPCMYITSNTTKELQSTFIYCEISFLSGETVRMCVCG